MRCSEDLLHEERFRRDNVAKLRAGIWFGYLMVYGREGEYCVVY